MSWRVDSPIRKLTEEVEQALPQIAAIPDKDERGKKFRETMARLGIDSPALQRELWREMCHMLPSKENPYIDPNYRKQLLGLVKE